MRSISATTEALPTFCIYPAAHNRGALLFGLYSAFSVHLILCTCFAKSEYVVRESRVVVASIVQLSWLFGVVFLARFENVDFMLRRF